MLTTAILFSIPQTNSTKLKLLFQVPFKTPFHRVTTQHQWIRGQALKNIQGTKSIQLRSSTLKTVSAERKMGLMWTSYPILRKWAGKRLWHLIDTHRIGDTAKLSINKK
jgi:hypothetical protein